MNFINYVFVAKHLQQYFWWKKELFCEYGMEGVIYFLSICLNFPNDGMG